MFLGEQISLDEIHKPAKHLMVFRASMLDSDFGGELPPGSRCSSPGEGLSDQPEWQTTREKIEAAGGDLIHIHTSATHTSRSAEAGQEIRPRRTVVIHTFEPNESVLLVKDVKLLRDGTVWEMG